MQKIVTFVSGLIFLSFGLVLLLANFGMINLTWRTFWPFIILAVGLSFELGYFAGGTKQPGLLVPGGILTTISIIFLICTFDGWHQMSLLWPLFILAPAIGLLQLYLFGGRRAELLVPVTILAVVGLTFLLINFRMSAVMLAVIMIILGICLIIKR